MTSPYNVDRAPAIVRKWPSYALAAVTSFVGNATVGNVVLENLQTNRITLQNPQVTVVACWAVVTLLLSIQAFRGWFLDPSTIQ